MLLTTRYRRFGPLPFNERHLAGIARCTRGVWNRRVWPAIQHFFAVEDGILRHPELDELRAAAAEPQRSYYDRGAANSRYYHQVKARKAAAAASDSDAPASEFSRARTSDSDVLKHILKSESDILKSADSVGYVSNSDAVSIPRATAPALSLPRSLCR